MRALHEAFLDTLIDRKLYVIPIRGAKKGARIYRTELSKTLIRYLILDKQMLGLDAEQTATSSQYPGAARAAACPTLSHLTQRHQGALIGTIE